MIRRRVFSGEKREVGLDENFRNAVRKKKKIRQTLAIILLSGMVIVLGWMTIRLMGQLLEEDMVVTAVGEDEVDLTGVKLIDREGVGMAKKKKIFLSKLKQEMEFAGKKMDRAETIEGKMRELVVFFHGRKEYYKVQIDRGAAETAEDIVRMMKHIDKTKIKPSYVDVRIRGRAYFK